MDLHFCSRCGISIPQSEIDSGFATGAGGKFYCSEHRGGAVAVAEAPPPRTAPGVAGEEPELLFCANCRVSIPVDDSKSGRAHREFGSLLCAGCSKADPGERAARREAVEAEMAADVDAHDPVVARRCSVCSAAVPYGQIVTGKAKVDGDRVTCERCRAAAVAAPSASSTGSGWLSGFLWLAVIAGMFLVGFFVVRAVRDQEKPAAPKPSTAQADAARIDADRRWDQLSQRLAEMERRSAAAPEDRAGDDKHTAAALSDVRRMVADLRTDVAKSDAELQARIARLEGAIEGLGARVTDLANRSTSQQPVERAPARSPEPPTTAPAAPTPEKKEAPVGVNPEVSRLCKELLESADNGTRFNAANELGTLKDPAAVPSLVKGLAEDKHYFVRRGCAIALAKIRAWLAVPALIKALEDKEPYVALEANRALQKVTGNDFGVNQDVPLGQRKTKATAAEKWWDKNRDSPPDGVSMHPITE
jgi:hypothetical protein